MIYFDENDNKYKFDKVTPREKQFLAELGEEQFVRNVAYSVYSEYIKHCQQANSLESVPVAGNA